MSAGSRPAAPARSAKEVVARAERLWSRAAEMLDLPRSAERRAVATYEAERQRAVWEVLARTPVAALKEAAGERLRLRAVEAGGLRTVADVLASSSYQLRSINGVGPWTSERAISAALAMESSLRGSVRVRFDVDARPVEQTALLTALRVFEALRRIEPMRSRLEQMMRAVEADIGSARLEYRRVRRFFATRRRKEAGRAAFERLDAFLKLPSVAALRSDMEKTEEHLEFLSDRAPSVWRDYTSMSNPL